MLYFRWGCRGNLKLITLGWKNRNAKQSKGSFRGVSIPPTYCSSWNSEPRERMIHIRNCCLVCSCMRSVLFYSGTTNSPQVVTTQPGDCQDVYPQYCPDYKEQGMCETHPEYTKEVCKYTCGYCGGGEHPGPTITRRARFSKHGFALPFHSQVQKVHGSPSLLTEMYQ